MQKKRIPETEYLYSSARVRALEGTLIGADKLEAAIMSKDASETEDIIRRLSEGEGNATGDALGARIGKAYSFIESISPDERSVSFLRYGYDCNNIKAAIKCAARDKDPDDMLFSYGSVPAEKIKEMPITLDFSLLPANMREAAREAYEEYAKTGDPQLVDIILDKACFADMLASAVAFGEKFMIDLVKIKIDITNIMMCIRICRMGRSSSEMTLLSDSLIDGGKLDKAALYAAVENGGEDALSALLLKTDYARIADLFDEGGETATLSDIECACDNYYMEAVRGAKYIPFGVSVLCAYLVATEYEVKNLRIILAGKLAGLSPEVIKRRVRLSYV